MGEHGRGCFPLGKPVFITDVFDAARRQMLTTDVPPAQFGAEPTTASGEIAERLGLRVGRNSYANGSYTLAEMAPELFGPRPPQPQMTLADAVPRMFGPKLQQFTRSDDNRLNGRADVVVFDQMFAPSDADFGSPSLLGVGHPEAPPDPTPKADWPGTYFPPWKSNKPAKESIVGCDFDRTFSAVVMLPLKNYGHEEFEVKVPYRIVQKNGRFEADKGFMTAVALNLAQMRAGQLSHEIDKAISSIRDYNERTPNVRYESQSKLKDDLREAVALEIDKDGWPCPLEHCNNELWLLYYFYQFMNPIKKMTSPYPAGERDSSETDANGNTVTYLVTKWKIDWQVDLNYWFGVVFRLWCEPV